LEDGIADAIRSLRRSLAEARAEQPPAGDATREEPEAGADLEELLAAYFEACQRPTSSTDYVARSSEAFGAWMKAVTALVGVARDERRRG
jgi:hypothetical protein